MGLVDLLLLSDERQLPNHFELIVCRLVFLCLESSELVLF